jgi:fluoroquinolone resistance protein
VLAHAVFEETDLTGTRFERCDLREADFTRAQGAFFDPTRNRVKGARVSLETAALVAVSLGLVVSGFSVEK